MSTQYRSHFFSCGLSAMRIEGVFHWSLLVLNFPYIKCFVNETSVLFQYAQKKNTIVTMIDAWLLGRSVMGQRIAEMVLTKVIVVRSTNLWTKARTAHMSAIYIQKDKVPYVGHEYNVAKTHDIADCKCLFISKFHFLTTCLLRNLDL